MKKKVIVIGGGFAGLSSAVRLSRSGYSVALYEQKRILGGRAYSLQSGTEKEWVDNGQHALIAGFHETREFLKILGTEHLVRFQKQFEMILIGQEEQIRIRALPLPAPWHLAAGIMMAKGLSQSDRIHLLRAGRAIWADRPPSDDLVVSDWLASLNQPMELCRKWWYPLSIAALNELPQRASARLLYQVMKNTFFHSSGNSSFGIMTVSLGELYTHQASSLIQSLGGEVFLSSPAKRIHFSKEGVRWIELQGGQRVVADYYIASIPPEPLSQLLPEQLKGPGMPFSNLTGISSSPIISIHLWYDRQVMEWEFCGFIDSPIHWVFNKSLTGSQKGGTRGAIACVTSGAHELIDRPPAFLIKVVQEELGKFLPKTSEALLLKTRVVKEREATHSCTPTIEKLRLPQRTPFMNFFVSGDWTDTGLPATIESAIVSGNRCASMIQSAN